MTRWSVDSFKQLLKATLFLASLFFASIVNAHTPVPTAAHVRLADDDKITIVITHDALAWAKGTTTDLISNFDCIAMLHGPEADLARALVDGHNRFTSQFRMWVDGESLPVDSVQSPTIEIIREWKKKNPRENLTCAQEITVTAQLPHGKDSVSFQFPKLLDKSLLVVHRSKYRPLAVPLAANEKSPPINLRIGSDDLSLPEIAWRFAKLGFTHIIPEGLDHCLFVLGLFLLSPRIKPVLWQISSFTVAHTITLTLVSLNIIGLPDYVVEPAIAASIAFVAIENLFTTKVHSWRIVVAFIFGLVHGMGVATVFQEAGFPPRQLVSSLAAFTIGVEAGHIAVLIAAMLALGWAREKKWYRARLSIPLSVVIALVALFWVVQRLLPEG